MDSIGVKKDEKFQGIKILFSKEPSGTYAMSFVGHPSLDAYLWAHYVRELQTCYTKKAAFALAKKVIFGSRRENLMKAQKDIDENF